MVFAFGALLDAHILKFAGLEDFPAFEALHELGIFVAAHDLHAGMLTGLACALRMRKRLRGHKSGGSALIRMYVWQIRGNFPVF
jgi:hypothetical protein